jgi:hypothetical protein
MVQNIGNTYLTIGKDGAEGLDEGGPVLAVLLPLLVLVLLPSLLAAPLLPSTRQVRLLLYIPHHVQVGDEFFLVVGGGGGGGGSSGAAGGRSACCQTDRPRSQGKVTFDL